MSLGNNRDYVTRNRAARRQLAVTKARADELCLEGNPNPVTVAMQEFRDGKLKKQLKAWVDPILEHTRANRKKTADKLAEDAAYATREAFLARCKAMKVSNETN